MTRLFRVGADGEFTEVDTTERLSGIGDALSIARTEGDGTYWFDYQTGQYHELQVQNGEVVSTLDGDNLKDGNPAADYDRRVLQGAVASPVSQFGMLFPEDGVVGDVLDSRPAVEEF